MLRNKDYYKESTKWITKVDCFLVEQEVSIYSLKIQQQKRYDEYMDWLGINEEKYLEY